MLTVFLDWLFTIDCYRQAKLSARNIIWDLCFFLIWKDALHYDNAPSHGALILRECAKIFHLHRSTNILSTWFNSLWFLPISLTQKTTLGLLQICKRFIVNLGTLRGMVLNWRKITLLGTKLIWMNKYKNFLFYIKMSLPCWTQSYFPELVQHPQSN